MLFGLPLAQAHSACTHMVAHTWEHAHTQNASTRTHAHASMRAMLWSEQVCRLGQGLRSLELLPVAEEHETGTAWVLHALSCSSEDLSTTKCHACAREAFLPVCMHAGFDLPGLAFDCHRKVEHAGFDLPGLAFECHGDAYVSEDVFGRTGSSSMLPVASLSLPAVWLSCLSTSLPPSARL